jgi:GDP-4-dehydro-6-deoxy-D-mannose reductase
VDTIFVTGAEGFTGSNLLAHLRQRGHTVAAGVRNRARKLAYERQGIKAIVCDVTDPINVARVIGSVRPDGVIHLAGPAQPADTAQEPLAAYQGIVTAWANVLDAVRRAVPRATVVLASAWDVYGAAGQDGQPVTETTPAEPVTMFGSLKHTAETIARDFYRHYHLNVVIARPFLYTGPGQGARSFWGAVARTIAGAGSPAENAALRLPDLSFRRDVLHVQDVVVAYERLLQDGRPNEVYNVCAGQTWTCREIVENAARELGLSLPPADAPQSDPQRVAALAGDNTKIRTELGWAPARSPVEAVCDLVRSLRTPAPVGAQPIRV